MRVPRAGCRLNTWLPYAGAATILVAELDAAGASSAAAFLTGNLVLDTTRTDVPPYVLVTNAFAARLLSRPLADATAGTAGSVLHGGMRVGLFPLEFAARNVVGVLEGSDPAVNGSSFRSPHTTITSALTPRRWITIRCAPSTRLYDRWAPTRRIAHQRRTNRHASLRFSIRCEKSVVVRAPTPSEMALTMTAPVRSPLHPLRLTHR